MSGYLMDTNVLAEIRKGKRCNPRVSDWFEGVNEESLFTSVLVVGEIRRGIELARRKDTPKADILDEWLNGLSRYFESRILPITHKIADQWGKLCATQKLPDVDGLLAATALVHDLTLVTRNTADFKRSGVKVHDPFVS